MRKIIPKRETAYNAASAPDADPCTQREAKSPWSPSGAQSPHPMSTIPPTTLGRMNGSPLEFFFPKFIYFAKPQASKQTASCFPPALLQPRGPCRPTIKMGWLSGGSWKVAITNPIYDSQRDKTKRWESLNKWKIVLSFNFIHQQDHLSFKKLG